MNAQCIPSTEEEVRELLEDDPELARKREECQKRLTALREAEKIIAQVKHYA